jgi:hypothetical protein
LDDALKDPTIKKQWLDCVDHCSGNLISLLTSPDTLIKLEANIKPSDTLVYKRYLYEHADELAKNYDTWLKESGLDTKIIEELGTTRKRLDGLNKISDNIASIEASSTTLTPEQQKQKQAVNDAIAAFDAKKNLLKNKEFTK